MEKYNLDSLKFIFRVIGSFERLNESRIQTPLNDNSKIVYNVSNMESYSNEVFNGFECIWNRIVRDNIYI